MRYSLLGLMMSFFVGACFAQESPAIVVGAQSQSKRAPLGILIAYEDEALAKTAKLVAHHCGLTGQLAPQIRMQQRPKKKNDCKGLAREGFPFVLWVGRDNTAVTCRAYDTLTNEMILGKSFSDKPTSVHAFMEELWPELMGVRCSFGSTIVACKEVKRGNKKEEHLYAVRLADPDYKKPLVTTATISGAPRWHPYKEQLFFCQHTPNNMRLMSLDAAGNQSVILSLDGLNMTPAVAPDGTIVVGLSRSGKTRLYRYQADTVRHKGTFSAITPLSVHAVSPSFIDNDRVLFCAIDEQHVPRVSVLDMRTHHIEPVIKEGSSLSPAYCPINGLITYIQRVEGVPQLFTADAQGNKRRQITFDRSRKDYGTWSPCGNFIAYTQENGSQSRIAVICVTTGKRHCITPAGERWRCPAWGTCKY